MDRKTKYAISSTLHDTIESDISVLGTVNNHEQNS